METKHNRLIITVICLYATHFIKTVVSITKGKGIRICLQQQKIYVKKLKFEAILQPVKWASSRKLTSLWTWEFIKGEGSANLEINRSYMLQCYCYNYW